MRQRAMIAMALSCNPSLLIADEPTTALDVTIQAQILDLMQALQEEFHIAIVMITHDLGVVAEMADHVAVMYLGQVVEYGAVRTSFSRPAPPLHAGAAALDPGAWAQGQRAARARSGHACPTRRLCREGCRVSPTAARTRMPVCDQAAACARAPTRPLGRAAGSTIRR